jgi:pimeloyl-ACP methyl ester carboxylesterase
MVRLLLLIHGGPGHADIWTNQVAELAKRHTMILSRQPRPWPLLAPAANVTVDGVDLNVGTNKTFGSYIERMGKDYARMSKTPKEYDAFVQQISQM